MKSFKIDFLYAKRSENSTQGNKKHYTIFPNKSCQFSKRYKANFNNSSIGCEFVFFF